MTLSDQTLTGQKQQTKSKHCKVVLKSSNSSSNYQILVCEEKEQHSELTIAPDLKNQKMYLYDSSRHTLEEVTGFYLANVETSYWSWGMYGLRWRWIYHYTFPNKNDGLWRNKKWRPYFERSNNHIVKLGTQSTEFDLSSAGNFPYWEKLKAEYNSKCSGWGKNYGCKEFLIKSPDLTQLLSISSDTPNNICFILTSQNRKIWTKKVDCTLAK